MTSSAPPSATARRAGARNRRKRASSRSGTRRSRSASFCGPDSIISASRRRIIRRIRISASSIRRRSRRIPIISTRPHGRIGGSEPMVHVFPYWDFSAGADDRCAGATNAPRDGAPAERPTARNVRDRPRARHAARWVVEGAVRARRDEAIAYDEDGRSHRDRCAAIVRRREARSVLQADKTRADGGRDGLDVRRDRNGGRGRQSGRKCEQPRTGGGYGAGRLVGLDNGDSTDYDPYKGVSRRLFSGKLMAIIAAGTGAWTGPGRSVVPGLETAVLEFEAHRTCWRRAEGRLRAYGEPAAAGRDGTRGRGAGAQDRTGQRGGAAFRSDPAGDRRGGEAVSGECVVPRCRMARRERRRHRLESREGRGGRAGREGDGARRRELSVCAA